MRWLPGVLEAIASQNVDSEVEVLACDSGSSDGSREFLVRAGVRVLEIEPGSFHHASARNRLMEHARGEFVAMITQDAQPATMSGLRASSMVLPSLTTSPSYTARICLAPTARRVRRPGCVGSSSP